MDTEHTLPKVGALELSFHDKSIDTRGGAAPALRQSFGAPELDLDVTHGNYLVSAARVFIAAAALRRAPDARGYIMLYSKILCKRPQDPD
jgi:hypothetical protein